MAHWTFLLKHKVSDWRSSNFRFKNFTFLRHPSTNYSTFDHQSHRAEKADETSRQRIEKSQLIPPSLYMLRPIETITQIKEEALNFFHFLSPRISPNPHSPKGGDFLFQGELQTDLRRTQNFFLSWYVGHLKPGQRKPITPFPITTNKFEKPGGMRDWPGGGDAITELLAARDSALVEPRVGVDGDGAALQLLYVDRHHDRLQQWQKTLDPHFLFSPSFSLPPIYQTLERELMPRRWRKKRRESFELLADGRIELVNRGFF